MFERLLRQLQRPDPESNPSGRIDPEVANIAPEIRVENYLHFSLNSSEAKKEFANAEFSGDNGASLNRERCRHLNDLGIALGELQDACSSAQLEKMQRITYLIASKGAELGSSALCQQSRLVSEALRTHAPDSQCVIAEISNLKTFYVRLLSEFNESWA